MTEKGILIVDLRDNKIGYRNTTSTVKDTEIEYHNTKSEYYNTKIGNTQEWSRLEIRLEINCDKDLEWRSTVRGDRD